MKYYPSLLIVPMIWITPIQILNAQEKVEQNNRNPQENSQELVNPAIDIDGYLRISQEAANYRQNRRLTEAEFIAKSKESGTIILDARSTERYNELHIKGAVNLSFPDIAIASLQNLIPDKNTLILIYCNNNFRGAETAFPTKMSTASLNISTYIALYNYGYKNVFELAPLLDIKASQIEFESTPKSTGKIVSIN
jgi:phage shock protein E